MIKTTKLNFLLLLLTCGLAMPSNGQQINTKVVYIWTAACTAWSVANYVTSDYLLKKRKLTDDCVALFSSSDQKYYKLERFMLHGAKAMSVISGITGFALSANVLKNKASNNNLTAFFIVTSILSTLGSTAWNATVGGLDYAGSKRLSDLDIYLILSLKNPTTATVTTLLNNGMDINGTHFNTGERTPVNLLQHLIYNYNYHRCEGYRREDQTLDINANRRQLIEYCLAQPQLDINAQDRNGNTALHYAVTQYDFAPEALELILKRDQLPTDQPRDPLAINLPNNDGNTALHVAVKRMNLKAIRMLIKNRASILSTNKKNQTPVQIMEDRVRNQRTIGWLTTEQQNNLPILRQLFIDAENDIFEEDDDENNGTFLLK